MFHVRFHIQIIYGKEKPISEWVTTFVALTLAGRLTCIYDYNIILNTGCGLRGETS